MTTDQPLLQFKSLDDIRARKEQLRKELQKDNITMKTQWNTLFHKQESNLPSHRFANVMSTGASVFDGFLLAWKLYNRFGAGNRKTSKKSKSKSRNILSALFSL